ncbi:hypothetical protein LZ30DRAFT_723902 [Colletotrichum cereale]|nr:hypothetical protein LZ30DRAFT_723902 [Colletotrichum cereale]
MVASTPTSSTSDASPEAKSPTAAVSPAPFPGAWERATRPSSHPIPHFSPAAPGSAAHLNRG